MAILWRVAPALLALVAVPMARPQTSGPARHTKVSLLAELDAAPPGRTLTVGVRLEMEPGWHTYWRNPGDAGLPTRVRWTLPEGFVAGEIRWPYPVRFVSGPVVSYGYAGEILLPVEIRVPATATGSEAHLLARVEWLECQEACLPGKAELSLTLPVRAGARPSRTAAAFGEARRRLPQPLSGWRVSAAAQADSVVLSLTPPRGGELASAQFFPITPRLLDYAAPQRLERVGQGYRLRLARDPNGAAAERVAGVLLVEDGGGKRALDLDVPLAR